jgi:pyridoxal phosphate enzyme (YggS family)
LNKKWLTRGACLDRRMMLGKTCALGKSADAIHRGRVMGTVADNLSAVKERIAKAAARVGRDPEGITLVAVTKTVPVERIREAIAAGQRVFGENRVQEAQAKVEVLGPEVQWHLIGHLQRNKVKFVCALFDLIESVDSLPLARDIDAHAARHGIVMPILIQVHIGDETTKSGVAVSEALALARQVAGLSHVAIHGLMCVPPAVELAQHARPYFITLRTLAEQIAAERIPTGSMLELSMGMSHDFEVAIEEGATMVRVGSAIFGSRPG